MILSLYARIWFSENPYSYIFYATFDYVKRKYGEKAKPCYIYSNSFIVHIKAGDIYQDIVEDVKGRFDTLNY